MYWNVTEHSAKVNMVIFKILRGDGWERESPGCVWMNSGGRTWTTPIVPRNTDLRFNKLLIRVLASRST